MRGMAAVLRRELDDSLRSPVAWVATVLLVLVLHAAFFFLGFPVGDRSLPAFWVGGTASLDALFAWLPVFYAVLAPALTMGAWAQERRIGTDELLFTLPVHTRGLVCGKFLAAWMLLAGITTVAVLPVAWMVASMGPLDWGTVWGGLAGAWMLSAACTAIGLATSALSREELVAFLVASVLLVALWSAGLFVRVLPGPLAELAWYASPSLHFLESGARGVLAARDVVYYGLLAAGGLAVNIAVVEGRRWA